ncbi:hypothetical protein K466DRAFT_583371 [Polyporus arcularius HHB13444]|uniref:Secreted protein n=1 Tax=Polyporus arcularius HHB13444 TaxID=1314778 RepID=A0A5C3PXL2_9APHY|nr:hypothetical protein K466DRAFT_583371 [Polyporus arcularius HHB13444]
MARALAFANYVLILLHGCTRSADARRARVRAFASGAQMCPEGRCHTDICSPFRVYCLPSESPSFTRGTGEDYL